MLLLLFCMLPFMFMFFMGYSVDLVYFNDNGLIICVCTDYTECHVICSIFLITTAIYGTICVWRMCNEVSWSAPKIPSYCTLYPIIWNSCIACNCLLFLFNKKILSMIAGFFFSLFGSVQQSSCISNKIGQCSQTPYIIYCGEFMIGSGLLQKAFFSKRLWIVLQTSIFYDKYGILKVWKIVDYSFKSNWPFFSLLSFPLHLDVFRANFFKTFWYI